MFGINAFDSARASMDQSSFRMGMQDRQESIETAAELVNFYEGNQRAYLEKHIDDIFKSPKLRSLYKTLILFMNVTSLIVDRVTILGKRKAEIKFVDEAGNPHEADQKLWDRIADEELEHGGFDPFLKALGTYKELCKTVVAVPFWDPRANKLRLRFYTPNVIDVAWDLNVGDPLSPSAYRILLNDQQNRFRVFDFSDPAAGKVYEAIGTSAGLNKIPQSDADGNDTTESLLAAIDPGTGLALDPFVAFRTTVPRFSYFVDDGQGQMAAGQKAINRLWTQLMGVLHNGAFQVPILTGPAWSRREGSSIQLTLDPSEGISVPSVPGESIASDIRWDGPANEAFIEAHLKTIARVTESLVSTFHISPNEVIAKADAASGVSLFIGSSSLKEKQEGSAVLDRPSLRELVRKTTIVWNTYSTKDWGKFSGTSRIAVKIPTQPLSLDPQDEVKRDAVMVEEGFVLREDIVKKYNPDATPEKIAQIMKQKEIFAPPALNSLFRSSTIGGSPVPPAAAAPKVPMPPASGGVPKPAVLAPAKPGK